MKGLVRIVGGALCAFLPVMGLVSCDKTGDENGGGENLPKENVLVVDNIPDPYFQAYYYGDYYEVGTGNVAVALVAGNIIEDEDYNLSGTGTILYLDMNIELIENPDGAKLPVGVYTMDADETYAAGTWGPFDSYVIKLVDDEVVYEYAELTAGTLTVAQEGDYYKVTFAGEVEGDPLEMEYVGNVFLTNSMEESEALFSNLDKDITVGGLSRASMACMGDLVGDEVTETWVFSIGDKHYDLATDYGLGNSVLIYLNVAPGLDAVPAGHYETFVDMMTAETLEVNTLIGGVSMYGFYAGCWFICPAYTYEAALVDGSVDVAVEGDEYTISGELLDGYGHKVKFEYEGPVELMQLEPMYASKSASAEKGFVSRKPSFFNKK